MMLPAFDELTALCRSADWVVTRSHDFARAAHINIQELSEVLFEVIRLAQNDPTPQRSINGPDSMVVIGARAKGRPASPPLNLVCRRATGWRVFGSKDMDQFKLGTHDNPSDDPSRRAALREPDPKEPWMSKWLGSESCPPPEIMPLALQDWEPQGVRLGDRLPGPVWCTVGRECEGLRNQLAAHKLLVGRHFPDPTRRDDWRGRSVGGWRLRWTSWIYDIRNGLCSSGVLTVGSSPGGLLREKRSYCQGPRFLPSCELEWWDEPDTFGKPERRSPAVPLSPKDRAQRVQTFVADLSLVTSELHRVKGIWLIIASQNCFVWQLG